MIWNTSPFASVAFLCLICIQSKTHPVPSPWPWYATGISRPVVLLRWHGILTRRKRNNLLCLGGEYQWPPMLENQALLWVVTSLFCRFYKLWWIETSWVYRYNAIIRICVTKGSMYDIYIHLHLVDLFMVNLGKYTIHGSYGIYIYIYPEPSLKPKRLNLDKL